MHTNEATRMLESVEDGYCVAHRGAKLRIVPLGDGTDGWDQNGTGTKVSREQSIQRLAEYRNAGEFVVVHTGGVFKGLTDAEVEARMQEDIEVEATCLDEQAGLTDGHEGGYERAAESKHTVTVLPRLRRADEGPEEIAQREEQSMTEEQNTEQSVERQQAEQAKAEGTTEEKAQRDFPRMAADAFRALGGNGIVPEKASASQALNALDPGLDAELTQRERREFSKAFTAEKKRTAEERAEVNLEAAKSPARKAADREADASSRPARAPRGSGAEVPGVPEGIRGVRITKEGFPAIATNKAVMGRWTGSETRKGLLSILGRVPTVIRPESEKELDNLKASAEREVEKAEKSGERGDKAYAGAMRRNVEKLEAMRFVFSGE